MTRQIFTIYGNPVPQGRPRVVSRNGRAWAFDPPESKKYKAIVAAAIAEQRESNEPIEGPIAVTVTFHLPESKTRRKSKITRESTAHISRPDLDNLVKGILDGAAALWGDDAQVCHIEARKLYGEPPRVVLAVESISAP